MLGVICIPLIQLATMYRTNRRTNSDPSPAWAGEQVAGEDLQRVAQTTGTQVQLTTAKYNEAGNHN